jgi:hypothetical protein
MAEAQQHFEAAKLIPHFQDRIRLHTQRRRLHRPDSRLHRRRGAVELQHAARACRAAQEVAFRDDDVVSAEMEELHLLISGSAATRSSRGQGWRSISGMISWLIRWIS